MRRAALLTLGALALLAAGGATWRDFAAPLEHDLRVPTLSPPQQLSNAVASASPSALLWQAPSVQAARRVAVPILVYHHIGPPPHNATAYLFVSPGAFAKQMAYLARHGYQPITLEQLYRFWVYNAAIPRKPLVITFDDGWRGVYESAAPVLARYGWPAVLNLIVSALDQPYALTSAMVRSLIGRGWEVDCHSMTHPDLTQKWPGGIGQPDR